MHFAALIIGKHSQQNLKQFYDDKADYFSQTRGNFVRFRPGLQHYDNMEIRNRARRKVVQQIFDGEPFTKQVYDQVINVFSDDDIEYAGNINWKEMTRISYENEMESSLALVERFPDKFNIDNAPFDFNGELSHLNLEEYTRLDSLWAPYAIYDFTVPNFVWWERPHGQLAALNAKKEQHEYILSIELDKLVTLYHCHR